MFQSYALFPHLDVFENVAFGLRRKKVDRSEIERRVKESLELVDLPGFDRRKPSQLSGGQQQRVALARALVNQPKLLLLDEPLGALDLKLRKQMQLELKRIQQEVGITFIYVTHDQEEAMTMSNRLAVMRHGKIEQIGPPEDVYENPQTEFVAGFLGASNLLDGEVKEQTNGDLDRPAGRGRRRQPAPDRAPFAIRRLGEGGGPAGEDHDRTRERSPTSAPGLNSGQGLLADVHVHRGEPPVQGGGPGRSDAHRLGAEPRSDARRPIRVSGSVCRGGRSTRSRSCRRRIWNSRKERKHERGNGPPHRDEAFMEAMMRARLTRRRPAEGRREGRGRARTGRLPGACGE